MSTTTFVTEIPWFRKRSLRGSTKNIIDDGEVTRIQRWSAGKIVSHFASLTRVKGLDCWISDYFELGGLPYKGKA